MFLIKTEKMQGNWKELRVYSIFLIKIAVPLFLTFEQSFMFVTSYNYRKHFMSVFVTNFFKLDPYPHFLCS